MELENLKNAWTSVDERLEKQEIVNETMIIEALKKKSYKSLKRLKIWNLLGVIIGLPLVIYIWYPILNGLSFSDRITIISGISIILCTFILAISIGMHIYALMKYLLKIDFSESVKENTLRVGKYEMLYRKANVAFFFIIIPVFLLIVTTVMQNHDDNIVEMILLTAFIVAIIVLPIYFIERRFYEKHIRTIKESLEELKELEEIDKPAVDGNSYTD